MRSAAFGRERCDRCGHVLTFRELHARLADYNVQEWDPAEPDGIRESARHAYDCLTPPERP